MSVRCSSSIRHRQFCELRGFCFFKFSSTMVSLVDSTTVSLLDLAISRYILPLWIWSCFFLLGASSHFRLLPGSCLYLEQLSLGLFLIQCSNTDIDSVPWQGIVFFSIEDFIYFYYIPSYFFIGLIAAFSILIRI